MAAQMSRHPAVRAGAVVLAGAVCATLAAIPATAQGSRHGFGTGDDGGIVLDSDTYRLTVDPEGFRYAITRPNGTVVAPAHESSGLVLDGSPAARAEVVEHADDHAVFEVTADSGAVVTVEVAAAPTSMTFTVDEMPDESGTIDFRTGPVAPAYGLGDYGSHANGERGDEASCTESVTARPTTELTGLVVDDMANRSSCMRFISNFTVFPAQSFAQVLFDEGVKRVALTEEENRLGVADADRVDALHYFVGHDLRQVYADYRDARHAHGYVDAEPRQLLFEVGWESYGALGWNTHQSAVTETINGFREHGYDLRWGIIGSGFWPGPRGNPSEGTTTSFGMWDDECDYDPADGSYPQLPCPRYPAPDDLKGLFDDAGMSLLLGLRNNMKAPDINEGWNPHYDGDFAREALERGYFLAEDDGSPVTITDAFFPAGPQYVLDADDPEARAWYVEQSRTWEADGFKEDAMLTAPVFGRDGIWNPLLKALHDEGDAIIVRNAAYSVPGDVVRANDTKYGHGENYTADPDRLPVNLLNFAASGAPNVYGDYVGGTPSAAAMVDPSYQDYFVRNAWTLAVTPAMAFGRGPWEMDDPEIDGDQGERYAAASSEAADFHERMVPYIYDAALDSHRTGFPTTMTPLPVAFPDDPATYALANDTTRQYEWMMGENLLATPVYGADFETAQTRDVYLPEGHWIDYATGTRFEGPTTLEDYPLGTDRAPVFVGGNGVVVERDGEGLRARVFPVGERGGEYEFDTAEATGSVRLLNTGWDTDRLRVVDRTAGHRVEFDTDPVTGAIEFDFDPAHDYQLVAGADDADTIDRETAPPAATATLSHTVDDAGQTTLAWDAVDDARSYLVQVEDACGISGTSFAGSTVGPTSTTLPLGDIATAGGTYRVIAWSSGGPSQPSRPYEITPDNGGSTEPVTVTDEGTPLTCDPDNPAYSEDGYWRPSSNLLGFDGSKTRFSSDGTATWRANLTPGKYEVSVWYPGYVSNTAEANYRIADVVEATEGTEAVVTVDQRNGGEWVNLGTYTFLESDQLARVMVGNTDGRILRADAVRFTPAPG